jgi:hypothetical protein
VLVADGLTLPFEPLIDWSHAAVWVEEAAVVGPHALTAHALLARLPRDPATVARMRANVAAIYRRYFASPTKRADALLLSALAFARTRRPPYDERPVLCRDRPHESLLASMSRLKAEQHAEAMARCGRPELP